MSNEQIEFESDVDDNEHTITSRQCLTEKDTGRVVAVFYNDSDLQEVVDQLQAAHARYAGIESEAVPKGWKIHAKVNAPADISGQRIIGYRVTLPESVFSEATDYLPALFASPAPAVPDGYAALLKEAAELFRFYEQSHRVRGPEHLEKANRNAEIAGRIEAMLTQATKESDK